MNLNPIFESAREAGRKLNLLSAEKKDAVLRAVADEAREQGIARIE